MSGSSGRRRGEGERGHPAAVIAASAQTDYERRPEPGASTGRLLAEAALAAIAQAGLEPHEVDGLGVSSFTLTPDRPIDFAWRTGLRLRWMMEDPLGLTVVQQARRAIETGDARNVVVVGGDRMDSGRFREMTSRYNRTTEARLVPIGAVGPNAQFSFLTAEHRRRHGLGPEAYGQVVKHQRARAALHRNGLYREPLTLQEYRDAPLVTSELRLFDCVPLVAGANAVVLRRADEAGDGAVRLGGYGAVFNHDDQQGDGLHLGFDRIGRILREEHGFEPERTDVLSLYDDYPVIVLQQLQELGFLPEEDWPRFAAEGYRAGSAVVNPSGGLLCCGQAGAGGTLHGLVDAVEQLQGRAGDGQLPAARRALVTNYGMILYRYGACAAALMLEAGP